MSKKQMPPMQGKPMKRKINFKTLGRTLKMLFGFYPVLMPLTIVCILFSAVCATLPSLFLQNIIEIIGKCQGNGLSWAEAKGEIIPLMTLLATLYLLSLTSITVHTQLMAYITQGFLNKMRRAMFDKMQNLPIKYFDTHKHGDIMSHYTNDIDTLRQLVSQAMPSIIQAGAIVCFVVSIMLYFSVWMTLVVMVGVCFMIYVSKTVGGGSAKYFIRQQKAMGRTEGFIQEMMNGQKVVKVFCHEDEVIEEFDKVNEELFQDSSRAHAYANMMGPIIGNIGNILYVLMALVGGIFILTEIPNLCLSRDISMQVVNISIAVPFLNMTKQFTGNVNQLS